MIVCQCNVLSKAQIELTVDEMLAEDPWRVLTPNGVYREMGKRGRCCTCFPVIIKIVNERMLTLRAASE